MSTPEIANLLRAIADLIERNSPSEIAALNAAMRERGSNQRGRKTTMIAKANNRLTLDLATLAARILDARDRDEAKRILESEGLTRRELTKLGQTHNVHIVKEDKVDLIEEKIVEALVGSRLSSKAIRGDR